jgi:hypothetical protein
MSKPLDEEVIIALQDRFSDDEDIRIAPDAKVKRDRGNPDECAWVQVWVRVDDHEVHPW